MSNHCTLSKDALEWLNGELLGDGCLASQSLCSAFFRYSSKYIKYIQYVSDTLLKFGIRMSGKIHRTTKSFSPTYRYQSRFYKELLPLKHIWYPENKKIVPRCIRLSSIVCRQWYIGDGSLIHSWHRSPLIVLSTNAFPIYDVEWLCEQLGEIGILAMRNSSSNVIKISTHSTKDFLNYIGECPIKCYQYKWNYYNKKEEK